MSLLETLRNGIEVSSLLVASVGALFSIASALYLTSRKISAELRYRRVDLTKLYSENLLKRRIEIYPALWAILGRYNKPLKGFLIYKSSMQNTNLDGLLQFSDDVSLWDSENGLILSTHSARACAHLRRALRAIVEAADKNGSGALSDRETDLVIDRIRRLEIALRVDVGIYEVDKLEARKTSADYGTINRATLGKNFELYPEERAELSTSNAP